jgi:hypothetical protein
MNEVLVAIALLRNDFMHLTATVELMRGDMRETTEAQRSQCKEHTDRTEGLVSDLITFKQDYKSQMRIFKWIGGIVTAVVIALAVSVVKGIFGL